MFHLLHFISNAIFYRLMMKECCQFMDNTDTSSMSYEEYNDALDELASSIPKKTVKFRVCMAHILAVFSIIAIFMIVCAVFYAICGIKFETAYDMVVRTSVISTVIGFIVDLVGDFIISDNDFDM